MTWSLETLNNYHLNDIFLTITIVAILVVLQRISLRYAANKKWSSEKIQLRVHTHVRNIFLGLITISVISIWIPQIQSFAISIAAIAVAVVVSLKEIIMLFTGVFIRTTADLLSVGDRISINGIQGDVIRTGFITTDLLEVGVGGQRTGRIIHLPNSYFLTYAVFNESAVKDFTFEVLTLPLLPFQYRPSLKQAMLEEIKKLTTPYIEQSQSSFNRFVRTNAINSLSSDARVLVHLHSSEEYQLILRFPVPIPEKVRIEQKLIEKFISLLEPHKKLPS